MHRGHTVAAAMVVWALAAAPPGGEPAGGGLLATASARDTTPAVEEPSRPPPLPPGFTSLGRNDRGYPQARCEKDRSVLIWVPGGACLIGSTAEQTARAARVWAYSPTLLRNETPQHEVVVEGFWIQKTEVTNTRYARFLRAARAAGGHLPTCPAGEGERHDHRPEAWQGDRVPTGRDDHPVTGVDWQDARAYAAWAGMQLPAEVEWEKAARWDAGEHHARIYPWGDRWRRAAARTACEIAGKDLTQLDWNVWWDAFPYTPFRPPTRPAGTYGDGLSPYGLQDMAGNVWEWCEEEYDSRRWARDTGTLHGASGKATPKGKATRKRLRVVRGGSWIDTGAVRAATRAARPQDASGGVLGFRCVLPGEAAPGSGADPGGGGT